MATTFVDTVEVKNIGNQMVILNIKAVKSSSIFDKNGGNIQLVRNAIVEAEDNRFDLRQLAQMRKLGKIQTTNFSRQIEVTGSITGSGS
jgi:hypothetical protein